MIARMARHRIAVAATRLSNKIRGHRNVHLLHIGKTGGTALKHTLGGDSDTRIITHPHGITVLDVPRGDGIIFFVREPVSRFVSGFFSRKRKGFPAHDKAWSEPEREAFSEFETPELLAFALSDLDEARRHAAERAMHSIEHVRSSYWDWFRDLDTFRERVPDIVFVGQQESFPRDFERLKRLMDWPENVTLSREPQRMHRAPQGEDRRLSQAALHNLRSWYAREYTFTSACAEWRTETFGVPFDVDYAAVQDADD